MGWGWVMVDWEGIDDDLVEIDRGTIDLGNNRRDTLGVEVKGIQEDDLVSNSRNSVELVVVVD